MSRHNCENCTHKVVCALWEIQNELCDSECSYYQPTITPQNEPLTIEQLREMNGEPVWVVLVDEKFSGLNGWYLVHHGSAYLARIDDWELDDDKYGVEWLAYRRPPERQEDTCQMEGDDRR